MNEKLSFEASVPGFTCASVFKRPTIQTTKVEKSTP